MPHLMGGVGADSSSGQSDELTGEERSEMRGGSVKGERGK